jgi:hypothetical protein
MFSQMPRIFTDYFFSVFICVICELSLIYYSYQALFIFQAADIEINQNPDFLS